MAMVVMAAMTMTMATLIVVMMATTMTMRRLMVTMKRVMATSMPTIMLTYKFIG